MAIVSFPPTNQADEDGLLAVGGDTEVSSLILAYSQGIFPWPLGENYPLAWFSPDPRGILQYQDLIINRSLSKVMKQNKYVVKFNTNFSTVISECAKSKNRKEQEGTWITKEIVSSYIDLYNAGYAYSVETYFENKLVGGIYGVQIGGFVSGESMFYKMSNASKIALVYLMKDLHKKNIEWIDTQLLNPFLEKMGATEIPREKYLRMLNKELKRKIFN